jgi:hypothetical protein
MRLPYFAASIRGRDAAFNLCSQQLLSNGQQLWT